MRVEAGGGMGGGGEHEENPFCNVMSCLRTFAKWCQFSLGPINVSL